MKKQSDKQEDDGLFDDKSQDVKNNPEEQNEGGMYATKPSKRRRIGNICLAVGIGVSGFWGGFFVNKLTVDDEINTLLKIKERIQKSYYQEISDELFYNTLFEAINEKILDPYSSYMTEEEYAQVRTQAKGEQSGIGLVFNLSQPNEWRIVRVSGNSPAERAGVQAGDLLVGYGVDEQSIASAEDYADFSEFLKGYKTGETFFLQFEKTDGSIQTKELSKQVYLENYVFYRTNQTSYNFSGDEKATPQQGDAPLAALPDSAAYIRLTQFNGAAAEEFAAAMDLFQQQGKTDLVLDLRGNGGGYLDIMSAISRYFCKGASQLHPVVAIADYGEYKQSFSTKGSLYDEYFTADSRITVLADSGSASASECLLGCMYDYGAIGYDDICLIEENGVAKTYGKGIMQTTYPLSGLYGDAIRLTTAKILWPLSQNCIHGVGITTDNGATSTPNNYNDEAEITAAIGVLYGVGI